MDSIPKSWIYIPLTSLYYLPTGVKEYSGLKPYYSTGSIKDDAFTSEGDFTYLNRPSRANRLSETGDIFQARMKATNKALFIDEKLSNSLFSTGFFQLRPSENTLSSRYLLHYFSSSTFLVDKDDNCTGATQQSLNDTNAKKILIPLPPLNEQKRIAKKLDELLATVESIKTRLDKAPTIIKRFRQSILAATTSGKLTEEWREKKGVSEEWIEIKIDSVLEDIRYGTSKKCSYDNEFTPVLRIPNITDDGITTDDVKYAQFNEKELENLSLKIGDILIIRSNGSIDLVGKNVVVAKEHEGYLFAGYLIRMRLDKKKVLPNYLHYVLTGPKIRGILNLTAKSTSGVNNVNSKELASFPISLPLLEEQKEIVSQVESLFSLADTLEEKIEAAKKQVDKLTQSILAKAFKGELVPQDPNDEPAEMLLERIKVEKEKEKLKKTKKKK